MNNNNYTGATHRSVESAQKMTLTLLKSFFTPKNALISTPIFEVTANRIRVQVFYYVSSQSTGFSDIALKALSNAIQQL
jgi:hypothetical protein